VTEIEAVKKLRFTFALAMKRFIAIIWVTAVLGQAFVRTAWTLDYLWNRAQYVAQCENLYNVRFDCSGKCYLTKTIRMSEGAENTGKDQLPLHIAQLKDAQLYFEEPSEWPEIVVSQTRRLILPPYLVYVPPVPYESIFKPPGRFSC
jgi:hypothetical protein